MITIVDYKAGNVNSVKRAFAYLGFESVITNNPNDLSDAEKIVFPGVGHARAAMGNLKDSGLDLALKKAFEKGTPILGICLGMQIILSFSEEGDTECLDLIPGTVQKIYAPGLKVPHMGFNGVDIKKDCYLFEGLNTASEFYFVHSFRADTASEYIFASCNYGEEFPVVVGKDNLFAVQFHPEKSGPAGLKILENFASKKAGEMR